VSDRIITSIISMHHGTGMIVAVRALAFRITAKDIGAIFIVYITMFITRAIIVFALFGASKVLLKSSGYSMADGVFTTLAGLRGAISLSLILIVQTTNSDATQVAQLTILVCGVVFLTIAINGTTAQCLLIGLGIVKTGTSTDEQILLHYVEKRIQQRKHNMLNQLENDLSALDRAKVQHMCSMQSDAVASADTHGETPVVAGEVVSAEVDRFARAADEDAVRDDAEDVADVDADDREDPDEEDANSCIEPRIHRNIHNGHPYHADAEEESLFDGSILATVSRQPSMSAIDQVTSQRRSVSARIDAELMKNFRNVFLNVIRKCYWRHIRSGRIPRGSYAAFVLLNSIDVGLDTAHTPDLQDWDAIEPIVAGSINNTNNADADGIVGPNPVDPVPNETWCLCTCWCWVCKLLQDRWARNRTTNTWYILTSFIAAHKYAQRKIPLYLGEEAFIDSPEEVSHLMRTTSHILLYVVSYILRQ
jgi:hypothetical protein